MPRRHEGTKSFLSAAFVGIFHVRDLARVNKMMAAMHSRATRKRSDARGDRSARMISRKGSRPRDDEHGRLYLVDEDHLVFVAASRALADVMRRAIEGTLADAVEHVETRSVKVSKAARRPRCHEGLRALIERESARRLARLGATERSLRVPRRRRSTGARGR